MPDGSKQCILCGYGTNYPSNLKRHLNVKHHIGERKAPVQQFRCSYCHYNTTVKCNMQRHLRKVHAIPVTSDTVEDNATVVIIDNKQIDVPQGEDFDASMNDTGASDVEEIKPDQNARKSRKRQHPGDYFSVSEVPEDGSLVDNDSEVKGKQQKSSAVSDIECIYCHMCFADQGVLKQHIDEIHFGAGDSGFTCEHCSKEFRTEFSYRGHLASHINALQCQCGCSFNSNWQLKKHTKRCKIAKDGLEMQNGSNASNEVMDVSNDADNARNSLDHDKISAESPALVERLSSVANTMDSRIKSSIDNEKDSQQSDPEFQKQAKMELTTERNGAEIKTEPDLISKLCDNLQNARNDKESKDDTAEEIRCIFDDN